MAIDVRCDRDIFFQLLPLAVEMKTEYALVRPKLGLAARLRTLLLRWRQLVLGLADYTYAMDKRLLFVLLLAMEGVIFAIDLHTDPMISVGPFYLIPIFISAWFLRRQSTYLLITAAVIACVYGFRMIFPATDYFLYGYNLILTGIAFSLFEMLVWQYKHLVVRLVKHAHYVEGRYSNARRWRRLDTTIHRAIPEEAEEIVRLLVAGANEGKFDAALLTPERQHAFAQLTKAAIIHGIGVRGLWAGGTASVPCEYWVSVIDGRVAGVMMILAIDGKEQAERELHAIAVSEPYRGLGIGSTLIDFYCTHFKGRRLLVPCQPHSKIGPMIERRGFRKCGTSSDGYVFMEKIT